MNPELLNTLVDKKIVRPGTEVEAQYMAPGLDGIFSQQTKGLFTVGRVIFNEKNKVKQLLCLRTSDNARLRVNPDVILRIDGMEPAELGKAFDILPTGKMKKVKLDEFGNPVRRGRKPKHLQQGNLNHRDNRSKKLSDNNATKKEVSGKKRRKPKVAKKIRGCKQENRAAC